MIFLLAGTTSCNRAFGWCFAASGGRYVLQSRTTINHERCISPRVEDIVGGGAHHRAEHRSHSDDADGRDRDAAHAGERDELRLAASALNRMANQERDDFESGLPASSDRLH